MIVKYKRDIRLRIGDNGPTLEYKGKTYKPGVNPNDPTGMTKVVIEKNTPVNFTNLGDYCEAQIIADGGSFEKKEVVNENVNRKPAEG